MKKILMFLLPIIFIIFLGFVFFSSKGKISPPSVSLPIPQVTKEPTPLPSPTPVKELVEIENDLRNIKADLQKTKTEDIRLVPPDFYFDLGI